MSFIIVLIAMVIERFLTAVQKLRSWSCLPRYAAFLDSRFGQRKYWHGFFRLAAIMVPILLVILIISSFLHHYLWINFIFNLIVVLYCLGPRNFYAVTRDEHSVTDEVTHILVEVNSSVFAVLFWYVLLGPVGAVLYRLSAENQAGDTAAQTVTQLLEWIPARLFAFAYGLVGHFVAVMPVWLAQFVRMPAANAALLKACGERALGEDCLENIEQARSLVDRAMIVWLVVLALIILL